MSLRDYYFEYVVESPLVLLKAKQEMRYSAIKSSTRVISAAAAAVIFDVSIARLVGLL